MSTVPASVTIPSSVLTAILVRFETLSVVSLALIAVVIAVSSMTWPTVRAWLGVTPHEIMAATARKVPRLIARSDVNMAGVLPCAMSRLQSRCRRVSSSTVTSSSVLLPRLGDAARAAATVISSGRRETTVGRGRSAL